ncbi:MAG: signal peptidase I [Lachnospiraceae bacterium]|nr:signal peptidase I [Lachnospiraceae bacterium]
MENKNDNIPEIEFIEYDLVEDQEDVASDNDNIVKEEAALGEEKGEAVEEEEKELNIKKEILSWALMLVVAVGIAAFISNFVLINAFVPTGSMENTIPKKSRLIGLRLAYTFSEPERGDVIIFKNPNKPEENYVKRIIGLPGETVVLENSTIYVYNADGSLKHGPLEEPYLKNKHWMSDGEKYEFHIPKDRYLVLGDNRNNSADARTWYNVKGDVEDVYIHKDKIIAKAMLIYWDTFHIFKDVEYK